MGHLLEPARRARSWARTTSPGAAGNKLVPDLATSVPKPTERRQDVHVQAQERRQVRTPGEPGRDLRGREVRAPAAREPEERRPVRLLLLRDRRLGERRQGQERLRHHDAEPVDARHQADEAARRLPLRDVDAGDGSDPAGGRQVLRGQGRRVRPQPRLDRPVHDQGLGQGRHLRRATRSSRRAASTARRIWTSSATRTTTPKTDSKAARENFPDEFKFVVNANADDILNKIEAGEYDTATTTRPAAVPEEVLHGHEPEAVLPPELR